MSKKGYSRPGLFGSINHYDANGKKVGESRSGFFSGMNDYDANGKKIGHSSPFFFGGMNHYDNNGHKVGENRPGFGVLPVKRTMKNNKFFSVSLLTGWRYFYAAFNVSS